MDGAFVNSQQSACKEIFAPADEADRDFWPRLLCTDKKWRKETMKSQRFRQYVVHCFKIRRCNRNASATDWPENRAQASSELLDDSLSSRNEFVM